MSSTGKILTVQDKMNVLTKENMELKVSNEMIKKRNVELNRELEYAHGQVGIYQKTLKKQEEQIKELKNA